MPVDLQSQNHRYSIRPGRCLFGVLAPALVVAALACDEELSGPSDREQPVQPAFASASAAAGLAFRQVSGGLQHSCGVTTENRAYCWGLNHVGQIGDSTAVASRRTPVQVAGGRHYIQVDAGNQHNCGVTTENKAFCWGNGRLGQLGNGKAYLSFWPRRVSGGLSFERVTAGNMHSCAETTTNQAYCWGASAYGNTSPSPQLTPRAVAGGLQFSEVSAGAEHNCGRTPSAVAYCWGINSNGQIGDGTTTQRDLPTPVAGPS
jgi:alpha-tubulin suppressor-like RCC1 family protein